MRRTPSHTTSIRPVVAAAALLAGVVGVVEFTEEIPVSSLAVAFWLLAALATINMTGLVTQPRAHHDHDHDGH